MRLPNRVVGQRGAADLRLCAGGLKMVIERSRQREIVISIEMYYNCHNEYFKHL
jgi:hypothetical protein